MNLQRIGLIVNPKAGGGSGLAIARQVIDILAPREILTGIYEMGMDALRELPPVLRIFDWKPRVGPARTIFLAQSMAEEGADALVVIGGDGTLADVAFALHTKGLAAPILGIGAGSANVGPLITVHGSAVQRLVGADLTTRTVDGLVAGVNDHALGLGFNDIVIGFTVLATIAGQIVDVDAARKMQGENSPREPEPVWTERTRVVKRWVGVEAASPPAHPTEILIAQGDQVATVIAGLPDNRFYGKAITGGVLLSGLLDDPAGCLVCDHLLVRTHLDPEAHRRSEPVVSRYAGLNETERIEAWGFRDGTVLCADGNPLALLRENDHAQVSVRRALVQTIQIEE
jgi:hypothetical protein